MREKKIQRKKLIKKISEKQKNINKKLIGAMKKISENFFFS